MLTRLAAALMLSLAAITWQTHAHGRAEQEKASDSRAIVFPDTAEYLTLVADLHTHSVFSDGHVWPRIRVEEALRDGLDAMAVTEHLEYQPHRVDISHPDRNRAYEIAAAAARDSNLIVIRGSEITRRAPAGHMNAVFLSDANQLLRVAAPPEDPAETDAYYTAASEWPAEEAVLAANQQGAFVFWNHPYWTRQQPDGLARITKFQADLVESGKLHGIEIANGRHYSEEAFQIGLDHDLALIGVSDVHELIDWDYNVAGGGHRPVTLVYAQERSGHAIREALFKRRTVVWFKNLLIGRPSELDPLLAACVTLRSAHYVADTEVVSVTLVNHSDARFILQNKSTHTFMWHPDILELPPHSETEVQVKPGALVNKLTLRFEVMNALIAPKTHPVLKLMTDVSDVPELASTP